MSKVTITIHRGANQIGGCITEIATDGAKIFIDFGSNLPGSKKKEYTQSQIADMTSGADAIFYTHYHGDHVGLHHLIPESVRQYMGAGAIDVMRCKYKALNAHHDMSAELSATERMIPFKETDRISINDELYVTPYFVSHSAFDAYMFVIEDKATKTKILHTGDFRRHGYLGKGLFPTLRKFLGNVDILITEGTMLSRDDSRVQSEEELMKSAIELMKRYDNVFVMCSSMDADRISSFYNANKEFKGRPFVVDGYQWMQMKTISETLGSDPKGWRYRFGGQLYYNKHKEEIQKNLPRNGITMLIRNNYQIRKMIDELYPLMNPERTCLVYSQFRGYVLKEHKAFQQRTYDFIHSKDWQIKYLHTSGHASREALAAVCEKVNPRYAIIPIHRDAESDFRSLPISQELKDKVLTATPHEAIGGIDVVIK